MYGFKSWTITKAESQRIDAFELWCWRRLWRVPWPSRRSNQSILKEISPGISLEGTLRPALSLGGQATAWEGSPRRSLCLTKSSACGRLWQFAHPRPLSLLHNIIIINIIYLLLCKDFQDRSLNESVNTIQNNTVQSLSHVRPFATP